MLRTHAKIAWRNLIKNKGTSLINISGLAVGMTVAMLIGLWIWDELAFNKYHQRYDRIAQVMEHGTYNGKIRTGTAISLPMDMALRKNYGSDLKHITLASLMGNHTLLVGDKKVRFKGNFMGPEGPEIFTLRMLNGTVKGLQGPSDIFISQSASTALFGAGEPIGKILTLDNKANFTVSGVYEDLPRNSTFHDLQFIAPWEYYIHSPGNERSLTDWNDNSLFMFVELADHADMAGISAKIKDIKLRQGGPETAGTRPEVFLHPMNKWHLYSEFQQGVNTGGAIQYVWLFGIIGLFVLLLACINFMNLSTARSEKRAKEVGIRKAVGSARGQLIQQFYFESVLIAFLAFMGALLLTEILLPLFNEMAGKRLAITWRNPLFWAAGAGFTLFTGLIAGSYPALYLSSFKPVKVLKGSFKAGRLAAIPRQALVVTQFTVSIVLIIGTIMVFKQIAFAQNRPVGYSREGLVDIEVSNDDLHQHFGAVKSELLQSPAIAAVAQSSSPVTAINNNRADLNWKGKDPAVKAGFGWIAVTPDYGKTVGWQFIAGKDLSSQPITDSSGVIINEAAAIYMGFKDPVGEIIRVGKRDRTVLGVVKDMVMESPYAPTKPTVFYIGRGPFDDVLIKIDPNASAHEALSKIEAVCKTYSPSAPFSYRFADEEYAKKFAMEERVSKLATSFAVLAIFISCLGLFGMASFMAQQRVREIGIRKVLGASIFNLWGLLSKDFVILVLISICIAVPLGLYCMGNWLDHYAYRATMSWWIFAGAGLGALLITILTVSFQSIKAALMNPVKSLRTE